MKKYIGTKMIHAQSKTHSEYAKDKYGENNTIHNTEFSQQNKESEGYEVRYQDGYVSWSPKDVFEKAYREAENMNFGLALEAARMHGKRITRAAWNGSDMFVVYQKGYPEGIQCNEQTARAFGYTPGDLFKCRPYLQLRCADGSHAMWSPFISDVLADDWYCIN
jgi:hypothetical protein